MDTWQNSRPQKIKNLLIKTMQICPHVVMLLISCVQCALTASYKSKKGMNVIGFGDECSQFKVTRVHGCVCVLMYATGPGQYPAPAVGNKLWLLMNVPSKLWSYRAHLKQRPYT